MQAGITHQGSRNNLIGQNPDKSLVDLLSNERHVTALTPPTFIVHAGDDKAVNVANSVLFYNALIKEKVPVEMHLYEKGGHGFGMQPNRGFAAIDWPDRCLAWLKQHNLLSPEKTD